MVQLFPYRHPESTSPAFPALMGGAGELAAWRFLEFFTVNTRNPHTRAAYMRDAASFPRWCEGRSIRQLQDVKPMHVAGYIEQLQAERSAPTVKQHLACIRMLLDWLVTGQIVASNPAHAVRGARHSVSKGKTAVISSEEARRLIDIMQGKLEIAHNVAHSITFR